VVDWVLPDYLTTLERSLVENPEYYGGNLWIILMLEMWLRTRGPKDPG
jgi:hypothetical protein